MEPILILGCGYTARRVARHFLDRGDEVIVTTRHPATLEGLGAPIIACDVTDPASLRRLRSVVTFETRVLNSVPTVGTVDRTPAIMREIGHARRVLYLSTTGVYGSQRDVDARAQPAPRTPRETLRLQAEVATLESSRALVLRPAAIYGPHRGIHTAMRASTYRLAGDGGNFVSRIHVDDLAAHCIAGLLADVGGAWPVADEEPCTSLEIAGFCSRLLGLPMPPVADPAELGETRRADRRVDGAAIRRALGLTLRFPSYRVGIPACVEAEEAAARAF